MRKPRLAGKIEYYPSFAKQNFSFNLSLSYKFGEWKAEWPVCSGEAERSPLLSNFNLYIIYTIMKFENNSDRRSTPAAQLHLFTIHSFTHSPNLLTLILCLPVHIYVPLSLITMEQTIQIYPWKLQSVSNCSMCNMPLESIHTRPQLRM